MKRWAASAACGSVATWAVLLCVASARADGAKPAPITLDEVVAWLEKAETAMPSDAGEDGHRCFVGLAMQYARVGRWDEAERMVKAIPEEERGFRNAARAPICHAILDSKSLDRAFAYADALESSARYMCLRHLAGWLADTHDFARAEKVIQRMAVPIADWAWKTLIRTAASAGQYDHAEQLLASLGSMSPEDDQARLQLGEFIKECRASNRRDPPKVPPRNPAEMNRAALGLFAATRARPTSLPEAKKWVAAHPGAINGASCWREVAWVLYLKRQLVDCRKALAESLTCAEKIPDSFQRALAFVMIADLRLELGDKDEAIRLVDMVTAEWGLVGQDSSKQNPGQAEDILNWMTDGMEGLFVKPLVLDVFIRAGRVESATEFASRSDYPDHWAVIGAECAYSGQMGAVAKIDKDLPRGLPRAHFCLGVAEGLIWRMRAAAQAETGNREKS